MKIKLKINSIALYLIALLMVSAFSNGCKNEEKPSAAIVDDKKQSVPMQPVLFGGNRYVVEADFGLAEKVPLMIHGNAKMYLMLTHDIAEQLNHGKPIDKIKDYGYSEKGRGKITIGKFQIGDKSFSGAENVPVFDWPKEEGKAAQGMLGTVFLKKENTRIDFKNERIEFGVEKTGKPDNSLLDQGYAFTNLLINEKYEVYTNVFFDALQKEIPITVSTVSSALSLHQNIFNSKLKMKLVPHEKNSSGHDSPSGTSIENYIADSVSYRIGGVALNGFAELFDFAQYNNIKESELNTYGILGRDWMKQNNAIIDYANQILYFKSDFKN